MFAFVELKPGRGFEGMRIMGIDPGTAIVGYGIIEKQGINVNVVEYGCIRTHAKEPMPNRLMQIYSQIQCLIKQFNPDLIAVEELFFNTNAKTALAVGQARGVIILAGVNEGIDICEYTPLQVKQAVVGYGRADKRQVQYMVKTLLNLRETPKPDDVADALAISLCCMQSYRWEDQTKAGARQ
jgi:crossover junction endodeoxyribonuclease RuvC